MRADVHLRADDEQRDNADMSAEVAGTDRWDVVAGSYGSSPLVARLAGGLVDLADVHPDDAVLDVGTGTGLAVLRAASASGRDRCIGVDRSFAMLSAAAASARATAFGRRVSFVRADAGALPMPSGRFDVVVAASVWQFVGYAAEALDEWRRVLRPGGRLALSVPSPGSGASVPADLLTTYFPHLTPAAKEDFLARAARSRPLPELGEAMSEAGFGDVEVVDRSWQDTLPTPEDWWAIQWTHGVRFFLDGLPPEPLAQLRDDALHRLDRTASGEVRVTTTVRYCVARRV